MNEPTHRTPAEKLEHIRITDLEFQAATLKDAIAFLRQESRRLDTDETVELRRGVAVWINPGEYEHVFTVGPGGEARRVTAKFANVSLGDVFRFVAGQVGLELHVTESGVFLCQPMPQAPVVPASPVGIDRTDLERHIRAAEGYSELGLPQEANEELRPVLHILVACRQAGDWTGMERAAATLCAHCPAEAEWPLNLAFAIRNARGLEEGAFTLRVAVGMIPDEPMLHFHLACYESQLGHLDAARESLADAIRLQPACREQALRAGDLAPLHDELR